ncbi:MAG: hypothetical protein PHC50_01270 [Candidatus Cloacimonetes bacterium]|nr:hypothetical protein [Candidatus Cloacimonadota bacterium]
MNAKYFAVVIALLLLFSGLLAQDNEYLEIEPDFGGGGNQVSESRIPPMFIYLVVAIVAVVLYHYILNSSFHKCLVNGMAPEVAAASCLFKWIVWVGIIALIFIGIDIINIDPNNIQQHLINSIVRIVVILVLFVIAMLIVKSHKGKELGG